MHPCNGLARAPVVISTPEGENGDWDLLGLAPGDPQGCPLSALGSATINVYRERLLGRRRDRAPLTRGNFPTFWLGQNPFGNVSIPPQSSFGGPTDENPNHALTGRCVTSSSLFLRSSSLQPRVPPATAPEVPLPAPCSPSPFPPPRFSCQPWAFWTQTPTVPPFPISPQKS